MAEAVRESFEGMHSKKSLGLSRFARAILLNLFERSRGPRVRVADMWKVRWWRAYEGTIGGTDIVVSAIPAMPVGTRVGETAPGQG